MIYIETIDSLFSSMFSCCGVTAYLSTILANCWGCCCGRQKVREEIDVDKNGNIKIHVDGL